MLYNFTQNHKYFTLPLLVLLVKNIMSVPASWSNFASIESLDIQVPMISSIYTLLKYNRFIPSCLREYISQNTSRRKFQRLKQRGNTSSKPSHPFYRVRSHKYFSVIFALSFALILALYLAIC